MSSLNTPTDTSDIVFSENENLYDNPVDGKPIQVGHIFFNISKKQSFRNIVKWANAHNEVGHFPKINLSSIVALKRKFKKISTAKERVEFYKGLAHDYPTKIKGSFSEEDLEKLQCEDCLKKEDRIKKLKEESEEKDEKLKELVEEGKKKDEKIKQLIEEMKEKEKIITKLRKSQKFLRNKNLKLKSAKPDTRISYILSRKLFYICLLQNVNVKNIPKLVKCLFNALNVQGCVFSRSSVGRMVGELGFLSDVKTVEAVLNSDNVTIIFDSTTRDGIHVNCLLICDSQKSYVVNIQQLPGDTAADYCEHILKSLEKIARFYACAYNCTQSEILDEIHGKITCVLTDRASVNHATIGLLNKKLNKSLVELNCNIQPLEAITTTCLKDICDKETDEARKIFGNKSSLVYNIISKINSLRFNNTTGSIKDFKTSLRRFSDIKITRFQGNRINIIFHLSYIYYINKDSLRKIFQSLDKDLAKDLLIAFSKEEVIIELQVFAILAKIFSGPWMTNFYTDLKSPSCIKNGIEIVKDVINGVKIYYSNPIGLLNSETDLFGKPLDFPISEKKMLFKYPANSDIFVSMMGAALGSILDVLERQYKHQFEYFDCLRETALTSARQQVKSVIGEFSEKKKAFPKTDVLSISNMIKAKRNFVSENFDVSPELIQISYKHSRSETKANTVEKDEIINEEKKRLIKKELAEKNEKRNAVEKKIRNLVSETLIVNSEILCEIFDVNTDDSRDLCDIISGRIVGRDITHAWLVEHTVGIYHGEVFSYDGKVNYVIIYSCVDEEDEVYEISKYAIFADFICKDFRFV